MSKNVAVFVDVANIFYAAKAAGVDIDYVTLLKSAVAGRDFVRAYAYTGLDPENENQRNFHSFLARNGYKVVSKDIRKYGDGKVKANLDIELVVDMMKTARNLDVAIVVSGDGDFAPAIRAVQEMGVRVEVISFKGNTSSDLIEVADLFSDITQLAKVEKGSRSGRRVAEGDEDLSMTEVPDKQTEGSGRGRARGRGRGRTADAVEAEAPPSRRRVSGEGRSRVAASSRAAAGRSEEPHVEAVPSDGRTGAIVALPGERLSKAAASTSSRSTAGASSRGAAGDQPDLDDEEGLEAAGDGARIDAEGEGGERRRRRRRGGRGRGRGRGRGEGAEVGEAGEAGEGAEADEVAAVTAPAAPPRRGAGPRRVAEPRRVEVDEEDAGYTAPVRPSTPFGSFWDSQIGMPTTPAARSGNVSDDEDEDEPEIPEYLLAEQRRAQGGRGQAGRGGQGAGGARGGRGGRAAAYAAAIERERYGGHGGGGGINRYPDVSGRGESGRAERAPRQDDAGRAAPRRGDEPWSEVPPELAKMLLAQVGGRAKPASAEEQPASGTRGRGRGRGGSRPAESETEPTRAPATAQTEAPAADAPKKRTATRTAAAGSTSEAAPAEAPKKRTTARKAATGTTADAAPAAGPVADAPKKRTTARKAATGSSSEAAPAEAPAPKKRTTRKPAEA